MVTYLGGRALLLAKAYEDGYVDTDTVWEGPEAVLAAMHEYEQEEQKNEL